MIKLTQEELTLENITSIAAKIEEHPHKILPIPVGSLETNIIQIMEELFDLGKLSTVLVMLWVFSYFQQYLCPICCFFFLKDGSKIRRDVL